MSEPTNGKIADPSDGRVPESQIVRASKTPAEVLGGVMTVALVCALVAFIVYAVAIA